MRSYTISSFSKRKEVFRIDLSAPSIYHIRNREITIEHHHLSQSDQEQQLRTDHSIHSALYDIFSGYH